MTGAMALDDEDLKPLWTSLKTDAD